jgi:phytoene dehydrogenase-like protein
MDHGAIVVGGGHNGLVCAAYLARAGIDTVLLEARPSVGGCASTVDALGGRVNICNCDHTLTRTTPIIDELGLAEHGLRYLDLDPSQVGVLYDGGPAWATFHDVERTLEGLRRTYPDEVDGYRRYYAAAKPVAELILELANHRPTPGTALARVAERRAKGIAMLLRWSRTSAGDVLRTYFRSDAVRAPGFAFGPAVWGIAPSTPGSGLGALGQAFKHVAPVGRPVGGSGAFTDSLLGAFQSAGGTLRTDATVTAIHCEGERVRGVELAGGDVVEAPIVVSACSPHRTFVSWLRSPPDAARPLVERWRARPMLDGYESKIDAIVTELPRHRQLSDEFAEWMGFDPLHPTVTVTPGLDELEHQHRRLLDGHVTERPILFTNLPSVLDPTMVVPGPEGGHVFSLEVLWTPYALAGGWEASTEPDRWLDVYSGVVQPGFRDGIRRWRVMSPPRYEAEFGLPRGYATSFAGGPLAALRGRDPELTRYETPVRGLYLTGAATFPGAGIWGASGRNCARVILGV